MIPVRRSVCGALLAALPLAAACGADPPPPQQQQGAAAQLVPEGSVPPRDALLDPAVPHDVTIPDGTPVNLAAFQHQFDVYSWQTFVALNWPALPDGSPDNGRTIGQGGDAPAVWESYRETSQVFLADGSRPAPWGSPAPVPAACSGITAPAGTPVLDMAQKASPVVLDAMGQPFRTGPLVDQNGNYVRYAIHMNRDAFQYIVDNELYNQEGQAKYTQPVVFPIGDNDSSAVGAVVIKSAWKVMTPTDRQGRYHARQVLVYTPPSTEPPIKESCALRTMGLVGFHVAHKTADSPQWIWTTFEHVDNLAVPAGSGLRPTFYNPECTGCAVNTPPTPPWDPNQKGTPTQVVRDIPIDGPTRALNAEWQARLKGVDAASPWQYYELVSTQWPTNAAGSPTGNPAPQFLANTTLETYVQGNVPNVSSSCIMCHNNATTTASRPSDFSYMLELARSVRSSSAGGQP